MNTQESSWSWSVSQRALFKLQIHVFVTVTDLNLKCLPLLHLWRSFASLFKSRTNLSNSLLCWSFGRTRLLPPWPRVKCMRVGNGQWAIEILQLVFCLPTKLPFHLPTFHLPTKLHLPISPLLTLKHGSGDIYNRKPRNIDEETV